MPVPSLNVYVQCSDCGWKRLLSQGTDVVPRETDVKVKCPRCEQPAIRLRIEKSTLFSRLWF